MTFKCPDTDSTIHAITTQRIIARMRTRQHQNDETERKVFMFIFLICTHAAMSKQLRKQNKADSKLDSSRLAGNKQWSIEDKKKLLGAVRKFGHTDMKNICKIMESKSATSVKLMINKMMNRARSATSRQCTALDTWLTSGFFNNDDSPLPQALKFISLFEQHPSPEESNGFDFRAAYDYLHRATLGHPGMDLPPETLATLGHLLDRVNEQVWPVEEANIAHYLATLEKRAHSFKKYPPMSRLESRRMIGPDQDWP